VNLPGPVVGAAWLAEHRDHPDLRVIDLRWYLDGRSGRAAYDAGHVPGAVFVDLEGEVTGHVPNAGRHPLPAPEAFERAMRAAGVGRASTVVVYDDTGGGTAARLWWLLRHFGHASAAVLDGGLAAWPGPLAEGPSDQPPAGDFVAGRPRRAQVVDYEDVRRLPEGSVLLDARAPERYRGEVEPVDPRAGHIPGARSAFFRGNLDAGDRFLPPDALRRRYEELGAADGSRVVVYCGSGVNACHDLLALELAGIEGARLYAGSWSDWSNRPEAPAELG
jgi:thiosulfate/3-mercaptopyruvate sulfurtransferase